jgi:DNA-binding FrmR family transcriptional regulator
MASVIAQAPVDPDLKKVLADVVTQLAAVTAAANALRADHNTLIAKLNLDGGVTDTNYAASTASSVSTSASVS